MDRQLRMAVAVAFLMAASSPLRAQSSDASGHWQGAVSSPQGELRFELDLQKSAAGEFVGSVDIPGEKIVGLPLREVVVRGAAIEFSARTDQRFRGDISEDGRTMSGTFSIEGNALPFSLTRTGSAQLRPPVKGTPIPPAYEGSWNGTMPNGMRLVLQLSNDGHGASTAVLVNLGEGGLQIPAAASQEGRNLRLSFAAIGGSLVAALNAEGTELAGTYTQGERSATLTFRRAGRE